MTLQELPQFNLLHRLREGYGVSQEFVDEIARRLSAGRSAAITAEMLQERVAYLEQHVPPEIANPPQYVARSPRPSPESSD